MTADLYALLGVGRKAKAATIKKAYRNKAKFAHPDAGGSAQAFAALKLAYDILSDDARRKRYDATGEVVPVSADNTGVVALEGLAHFLDAVIGKCVQSNIAPTEVDLMSSVRKSIADTMADARNKRQSMIALKPMMEKLRGRFRRKKGGGANLIEAMIDAKLRGIDETVRNFDRQIVSLEAVAVLAEDYEFTMDAAKPMQGGQTWINVMRFG